jgi:hypothetical protein
VPDVTIRLSDSAEAASSKTLAALAQVIRALAPEVCGVSFHDFAADTLWLSEDFLPPEDHQLVQDSLSGSSTGSSEMTIGARDGARYAVAIPVRDSHGGVNGAVRLSIDSQIADPRSAERLDSRLAPVLVCLAAEFERRGALPSLPHGDEAQLALIENALHAERFELFLQPIRSLHEDEGLAHYEVLLRLRTSAAPTDRVARAMISAIVRMAGDLGIQTVTESVELDVELQAVRLLGVDYAQGFLLGRPRSLSGYDFEAFASVEASASN